MRHVEARQTWSVVVMNRYSGGTGRMTVTIDSIEGNVVHGTTARGRKIQLSLRVLQHGLRGSRLVGAPERIVLPSSDPIRKPTTRVYKPKGVVHVGSEAMEALRLQQVEGLPIDEIARRLGCTKSAVNGRLRRAREAQKEERYRNG